MADSSGTSVSSATTPPSSPTSPTAPPTSTTPPPPPPSSTSSSLSSTTTPPPTSTTTTSSGTGSSTGTGSGTSSGTGSSTPTQTTPAGTTASQSTTTVTVIAPPTLQTNTQTTPTILPTNQADSSGSGSGSSFFDNKAAVAGVFTIVGLAGLVLIIALLTNFIRRRRAAQFDRDVLAASAAPPTFYDEDMREPRAPQLYPAEEDMYDMQHYSSTPSPPRGGAYWNPNAPPLPPSQQWNAAPVAAQNPFASPPGSPPHPYTPYPPQSSPSPPQRAPSLQGGNARGAYAAMALAAEERARVARSPPPGQYPAALLSALDPAPPRRSTSPSQPQHGAADGSTSTTDEALPNPFRSRTSHESEAERKSIGDENDYWQPGRGPLKVANE